MDRSDSHQPFDCTTSTYVPEGLTAQNISPLATPTVNELNRVEAHVEPQVPSEAAFVPAQPSSNHRPYPDMIYDAVMALNEPAGLSKAVISRYIKRLNPGLPDDHDGLMTHHLNVMMEFGVLIKVKKSYKLAGSSPPEENVPVAAAAAADAGPVAASRSRIPPPDPVAAAVATDMAAASGSAIPPAYTGSIDMMDVSPSGSAPQQQKRGRGRPPKPKTDAPQQQQPIDAQPISQVLQPSINVEPELPVTNPTQESGQGRFGRPGKDGSGPSGSTANLAVTMKRSGWPTSCRAAGRERKPTFVSGPPASVIPVGTDGAGRPETPMRGGSDGVATLAAAAGFEALASAAVKRGRGRPPKRGRGRGRGCAAGRPIQDTERPVPRDTGTTQEGGYGEIKRKIDLAREKLKEILNVLNAGIETGDRQAAVQAVQEIEELTQMVNVESQAMEEMQPEGPAPLIEAETQGMELGQGSGGGGGGGGEQAQIHTLPQTLTQPQPQLQPETLPLQQTPTLIQPQPQTISESQPQTMTQLEPQIPPEFESLDDFELLPNLESQTLTQPQPQIQPDMDLPQTMTQLEPQIPPEFESLADFEHLPDFENLEPLPLTQRQPHILPPFQSNAEDEAMDEDIFSFLK